jgi:hypothetical protein
MKDRIFSKFIDLPNLTQFECMRKDIILINRTTFNFVDILFLIIIDIKLLTWKRFQIVYNSTTVVHY